MRGVVAVVIIVVFCLLGLTAGLEIGSIILSKSTVIRSEDWLKCMVGLPIIGTLIIGGIGVVLAESLDSFLGKRERLKAAKAVKVDTPTQFLVFGHTDNGRGIVVEVTALNGDAAIKQAKELRPKCKFNHVILK